jgi:hypothetical protein
MLKNKIIVSLFGSIFIWLLAVVPAKASIIVSIQSLPDYVNTNTFKLSCTSNGSSAQFYVSKHGGSYITFGSIIDLAVNPCVVQVTSSQLDEQTDYKFKVIVDGTESPETSTIYDASGPSPVSGYSKERIGDGKYKLHYHTPSDGDFSKVLIYRGETGDFSADGGHQIAEVLCGANSDMTYEDSFSPDASKTYYYNIRALDKANNSSGLTGDGGATTYVTTVLGASASPVAKKTTVTVLPKEKSSGSVLGTEATPEASATPEVISESVVDTNPGAIKWVLTHKKISLGVVLVLLAAAYGTYLFIKKTK